MTEPTTIYAGRTSAEEAFKPLEQPFRGSQTLDHMHLGYAGDASQVTSFTAKDFTLLLLGKPKNEENLREFMRLKYYQSQKGTISSAEVMAYLISTYLDHVDPKQSFDVKLDNTMRDAQGEFACVVFHRDCPHEVYLMQRTNVLGICYFADGWLLSTDRSLITRTLGGRRPFDPQKPPIQLHKIPMART